MESLIPWSLVRHIWVKIILGVQLYVMMDITERKTLKLLFHLAHIQ
jgi:hypothetical protein